MLQFSFLRVFPVNVQEAGRYVGLKLRENKDRALGNIYMCILGPRNAANNQNPEEAVEEDQE